MPTFPSLSQVLLEKKMKVKTNGDTWKQLAEMQQYAKDRNQLTYEQTMQAINFIQHGSSTATCTYWLPGFLLTSLFGSIQLEISVWKKIHSCTHRQSIYTCTH